MKVGDLVKAHIGHCRREGTYGVDYYDELGTIVGDITRRADGRYDTTEVLLASGVVTSFHVTRLEVVA